MYIAFLRNVIRRCIYPKIKSRITVIVARSGDALWYL